MVFQHDVAHVDVGLAGGVAEVEHELHGVEVLAGNVAHPEDVVLTSLQVHVVGIDDGLGVVLVGELHHHAVDVAVAVEDAGEVIVVSSRGLQVGVEVHLCLPFGEALLRHGDVVVVVAHLEEALEEGCLLVAPTRIGVVVERHGRCDALPHIEVAVGVEARELLLAFLAGEDESPGNRVVGLIVDEHHLAGRQLLHAEQRVFVLCVAGDIGEQRVGRQAYVALLAGVAVLVGPVQLLEAPCAGLVAQCHVGVFGCAIRPLRLLVDVGHAVFTGTVGVGSSLAVVGSEGDAVVVDAEGLLVVGLCRPPAGAVGASLAAAHVALFLVVDAPLLAGDAAEVGGIVHLRLVEGVAFLHAGLADAVAVAQLQLDGVAAGLVVLVAHLIEGGIGGAVENPDGIGAGGRCAGGRHLVGLLVDADLEVHALHGGYAVGVGAVEALRGAGGEHHASE